jgi:hypothetical protein
MVGLMLEAVMKKYRISTNPPASPEYIKEIMPELKKIISDPILCGNHIY